MILLLPFGSQVYGMTNPKSDKDYLAICIDEDKPENIDTGYGSSEVEIWSYSEFLDKLEAHDLKALEVYFENIAIFLSGFNTHFTLSKSKLRRAVSAVVSNAHVKAKKKLIDGEVYTGLKSYWHCIRILTMFNVLADKGIFKPSSFIEELDYIYVDIMERQGDEPSGIFQHLENDYKVLLKSLHHTFKLRCPLDDKS